jgi:beta-fructofuranosidase
MILGGRLNSDPVRSHGRLSSPDLETWEFRGDFWAPDLYSMLEMPDLCRWASPRPPASLPSR